MKETIEFTRMVDRIVRAVDTIPDRVGTEAKNFSQERFRKGNWVDQTTKPWRKRKPNNDSKKRAGRAILVDHGRLRHSIRKVSVSSKRVVIGTDVPYAKAHNEGFRGTVKQSVRKHTRRTKRGNVTVKSHSRRLHMNLPQRQFIGNSAVLNKRIERLITSIIAHAIKNT